MQVQEFSDYLQNLVCLSNPFTYSCDPYYFRPDGLGDSHGHHGNSNCGLTVQPTLFEQLLCRKTEKYLVYVFTGAAVTVVGADSATHYQHLKGGYRMQMH